MPNNKMRRVAMTVLNVMLDAFPREYLDFVFAGLLVSDISELLPPDMSDMKIKLEGYQLSEMNFFELTTILYNEFTKAFTEHRLIDSKKISNERFKKIIDQYDTEIRPKTLRITTRRCGTARKTTAPMSMNRSRGQRSIARIRRC